MNNLKKEKGMKKKKRKDLKKGKLTDRSGKAA
jgi:hypothetical protein